MFVKYTEKARRAVFFARYEASRLGGSAIEPAHLVLGIVRTDPALLRLFLSGEPVDSEDEPLVALISRSTGQIQQMGP